MSLGADPQRRTFSQPVLEMAGFARGTLTLAGSVETVDIAAELGFPSQPEWVTAAFEPYDSEADLLFRPGAAAHAYMTCPAGSWKTAFGCEYPSPQAVCPPTLARYGNVCAHAQAPRRIGFGNEALVIASAEVSFISGGKPMRLESGALAVNGSRSFALPADAQQVMMQGNLHGLTGKQPVFAVPVDLARGPACFATTGSALRVGWRQVPECPP
jgi:hypothetical protein